jgi:hypothetical protein
MYRRLTLFSCASLAERGTPKIRAHNYFLTIMALPEFKTSIPKQKVREFIRFLCVSNKRRKYAKSTNTEEGAKAYIHIRSFRLNLSDFRRSCFCSINCGE